MPITESQLPDDLEINISGHIWNYPGCNAVKDTLPETNIAPKNGWLEYYFPIGEAYFQGRTVSFREGKTNSCTKPTLSCESQTSSLSPRFQPTNILKSRGFSNQKILKQRHFPPPKDKETAIPINQCSMAAHSGVIFQLNQNHWHNLRNTQITVEVQMQRSWE